MNLPSEQTWLILNHLITDLNEKGYQIPDGINPEMGLIRSTISSYKRDPSHPDLINGLAKAEMSLNNIQGTLLTIAEEEGEDTLDEMKSKNNYTKIIRHDIKRSRNGEDWDTYCRNAQAIIEEVSRKHESEDHS